MLRIHYEEQFFVSKNVSIKVKLFNKNSYFAVGIEKCNFECKIIYIW